ncbi:MAG: SDR family oxidoreductase [Imperialibacter sp.]|uniref:NAD-dependent epimerase/dehydratase family protein n=1 Tax=Imperialibacter sp. TaxID=2038411 RepID=UPI0032EDF266
MNILITGGMGYVGGRLTDHFSKVDTNKVFALSRKSVGLGLPDNIFVLHPDDVMNGKKALPNIDVLIHLAALNEHDCVAFPQQAIEFNIGGTVKWLEWSLVNKVKQFIYFSTAHVYAKPLAGSFTEETLPTPLHPYAITHKAAEDYVLSYCYEKGLNATVLRLSNGYGHPAYVTADRWTLLVNDLCKMAVEKRELVLSSDGLQLRDFVTLADVCSGVEVVLKNTVDGRGEIFNLGLGHSMSVYEMALLVQKVAGQYFKDTIPLSRKASGNSDSDQLHFSSDKLKALGWNPANNYTEEIFRTLDFFSRTSAQLN